MKGLLKKELYSMGVYVKGFLLMVVVIGVLSVFMDMGAMFVNLMLMMYLVISSMTLFSLDENAKWDRFAVALPLKRIQIVGARYIFLALSMLALTVLSFVYGAIVAVVKDYAAGWPLTMAFNGLMSTFAFFFIYSFMAPVLYKIGVEKARMAVMVIFLLPYMAIIFLMQYIEPWFMALPVHFMGPIALLVLAVGVAVYVASATVSARIYQAKEF